jgi:hypothetical protein
MGVAAAADRALLEQRVGHLEQHHGVELDPGVAQRGIERLGLRRGAREAVEHEPAGAVRLGDPLQDHADHDLVRHQLARLHELVGLDPQGGALLDRGA